MKRGLLFVLPCIGVFVFIARNYVLLPFSDPANWLLIARQLGGAETFARFPLGYALYLWLFMHVVGPLYVFFANVPLVLAMILLAGLVTFQSVRPFKDVSVAFICALTAMFFIVAAGMDLWLIFANPYRDPLAHTLLLASTALLFTLQRAARTDEWAVRLRILLAGLLLGLAYTVRETNLLAAAPLSLYVWGMTRRQNRSGLLALGLFFIGIGAGILPVLIQGWLLHGQPTLSPYIAYEGRLTPGFAWYLSHGLRTAATAGAQFLSVLHGFFVGCMLVGAFFALSKKGSMALNVLLGTSLLYFVLYSFYWRYYERYFFLAALLGAPLAAYGLISSVEWITVRLRKPRFTLPLTWGAVLLLAGVVLLPCLQANPARSQFFRLEQARGFQRTLAECVPEGALVLAAPYRLVEHIRTLTPYTAHMPEYFWGAEPDDTTEMTEPIRQLKDEHDALYWMEPERRRTENPWREAIADCAGFATVARFPSTDFNLHPHFGWSDILLHKVVLHRHILSWPLPYEATWMRTAVPPAPKEKAPHRLSIARGTQTNQLTKPGSYLLYIPGQDARSYDTVHLQSKHRYSVEWGPKFLSAAEPLKILFGTRGHPFTGWLFEDYPSVGYDEHEVGLAFPSGAVLSLRMFPSDVTMHFLAQGEFIRRGVPPSSILVETDQAQTFRAWPRDQRSFSFVHPLDVTDTTAEQSITLSWTAETDEAGVFLSAVILHPIPTGKDWSIEIGSMYDRPFVLSGLYDAEREDRLGRYFRWSGSRAEFALYPGPDTDARILEMDLLALRPSGAPEPSVQLTLNEFPLAAFLKEVETEQGRSLRVEVPVEAWREGKNILTLTCTPWRPSDVHGSGDTRELGVAVTALQLR